jgi:hypothetical protein
MTDQLELPLQRKAPRATPEEVEHFVSILFENGGWMTAEIIGLLTTWSDRKCRTLAAASGGRIISGNHGYKHTAHISPKEFSEFYGRMVGQGKEMIHRAIKTKRVHHSYVG